MPGKVIFSLTADQAVMLSSFAARVRPVDYWHGSSADRRTRSALRDKGLLDHTDAGYVVTDAGKAAALMLARLAVPAGKKP